MTSVPSSTPGPLNPGDVVSAAIRLYRDRFKMYLGLAAVAMLWVLVPVYGWAKYGMHLGLMSRLAYQDLTNQPETPRDARRALAPKLWSFFLLGVLLFLLIGGGYFVIAIGGAIAGGIVGTALGLALNAIFGPGGAVVGSVISALIIFATIVIGLLWLVGRVFVAEVALSLEPQTAASDSIGRSWQLTKRSIKRIQFVVLATYLVALPPVLVFNIIPQFFLLNMEPGTAAYSLISLLVLVMSIVISIGTLPFWQVVKGVLYYDLRSRREGLDLSM